MSLIDRMITLDLGDKEPRFENICVVCNTPCRDDEFTMATSERYAPGTFVTLPGELFRVSAHTHSKKCALKLRIHWLVDCYGAIAWILFGLTCLGVATAILGVPPRLDENLILLGIFVLPLIPTIVYVNKFYYLQIEQLKQRGNNSRRYRFTFKNDQYAASFKNLNTEFLEKE